MKLRDRWSKDGLNNSGNSSDSHDALAEPSKRPKFIGSTFELEEQHARVWQQRVTCLRQNHASGSSLEQPDPVAGFQIPDHATERRLGNVDRFGRHADAASLGDGKETLELLWIEGHVKSLWL